jgi:hypothetical protein
VIGVFLRSVTEDRVGKLALSSLLRRERSAGRRAGDAHEEVSERLLYVAEQRGEANRMNDLRAQVVAQLSFCIDNLTALGRIHAGYDDGAATIIASAKPKIEALRDRYASEGSAPLDPQAAQELRDLSNSMRKAGRDSGNTKALRDLDHEARRIKDFVNRAGIRTGHEDGVRFESRT